MPELNDCTFDQLIEDYADIVIDRMDFQELYEFARETVIDRFENMTERQLIDHINEIECEETADEIISTHYGINPPDCYITDWGVFHRFFHRSAANPDTPPLVGFLHVRFL